MTLRKTESKSLLKVLSLNSLSAGIGFVLGIASTKIISVYLGTSGMALLGSFRNFTAMIKSVATLGLNNSLIKLLVENKNNQKELSTIYSTFFWIFFIVSIFVGGTTVLFAKEFSELIFFKTNFSNVIRFFGLLMPLIVINAFWISIYNGFEQFKKIIIIQIISNVIIFGCTTFLIYSKNNIGGLYAIAFGELVMFLLTFGFVLKDKSHFKFDLQKIIAKSHFSVIKKFSVMALLSALIVPLTLIIIRNYIVKTHSIADAGIWDATNKISTFYMSVFNSGLSLYYMPKLASLKSDSDFKIELKSFFKVFVPLFFLMLVIIFAFKDLLLNLMFTKDFIKVKQVLLWQLLGDLFRIMTLAFGYQILVKSRLKEYFIIELFFNITYLILSLYLVKTYSFQGALQSYFCASFFTLLVVLFIFRKIFLKKLT
jgi:O-antigen/teichoic acid export membrane protein